MIINTWNRLTGACFCMFIAGLLPLTVYAKTFEVRDTDDLPDINPGDGRCETTTLGCTLRAAIMELNRTFEPNDRIILRAGVYRLTIPPVTRSFPLADDGDLYLGHSQPLEIIGDDANTTVIEQTVEDRVMQIGGGADVSISSVTFRGGRAVETRREGGFSKSEGGGLAIAGDVHLNQIIVTGNQAVGGGGIAAHVSSGRLRIENTVIENNEATETGGGIGFIAPYPGSGTLELRDSIIDSNRAGTKGGGLSFAGRGEKLDIAYTKITNNRAGSGETEPCYCDGGGIFYKTVYPRYSSDIESRRRDRNGRIIDTLIRGNAAYRGGGIYQYGFDPLLVERILIAENRAKDGGGMVVRGPIDITNSTFSGNVAEFGGAIAGQFNPAGILGTDIRVRNAIDLHNTTIADNQAIFGSGIFTNSDKFSVSARGTIFANLPQERNCNLAGRS
ncbi:MAG: hypothetical protein OES09_03795, partial [Gammaproteobacteria bacterium]|nr:hypothetical protein [Gammaproteobacteria bacterium]